MELTGTSDHHSHHCAWLVIQMSRRKLKVLTHHGPVAMQPLWHRSAPTCVRFVKALAFVALNTDWTPLGMYCILYSSCHSVYTWLCGLQCTQTAFKGLTCNRHSVLFSSFSWLHFCSGLHVAHMSDSILTHLFIWPYLSQHFISFSETSSLCFWLFFTPVHAIWNFCDAQIFTIMSKNYNNHIHFFITAQSWMDVFWILAPQFLTYVE